MEQQMMEDRAGYYLETLNRVREQVQDDETARAILQEIGKDSRVEKMRAGNGNGFRVGGNGVSRQNSFGNGQGDQPATEKQLSFLKDLGMNPPAGLTKGSASALIDEARGKRIGQARCSN